MRDFFVSYNKSDRAWAEWIAWWLEESGYSVYFQGWDFLPGKSWTEQMQQATEKSHRTIAVLSPDYLASRFTHPEWQAAFARDPKGEDRILLPVRIRECFPPGLLGQVIYIDLIDLEEDAAKDNLLRGVKDGNRNKPEAPPKYPGRGLQSGVKDGNRNKPEAPPKYPGRGLQSDEKPALPNDKHEKILVFEPNQNHCIFTGSSISYDLLGYLRRQFGPFSEGQSETAPNSLIERILQPLKVAPQRELKLTIHHKGDVFLRWYPGHGRGKLGQKLTPGSKEQYKWRLFPPPISDERVDIVTVLDSDHLRLLIGMENSLPLIDFRFSLEALYIPC